MRCPPGMIRRPDPTHPEPWSGKGSILRRWLEGSPKDRWVAKVYRAAYSTSVFFIILSVTRIISSWSAYASKKIIPFASKPHMHLSSPPVCEERQVSLMDWGVRK